jgi:hypothetical protein
MKILIIIASHEMNKEYRSNIEILNNFIRSSISPGPNDNISTELSNSDIQIDYCGISNNDDFINYENIIEFKFKIINSKRQLSKVCDFITEMYNKLDYDWYLKVRPDFKFLGPIDFNMMSENSINARARQYRGPKKIKYGMSVNGKGIHKNIGSCFYDEVERELILDDCVYIFHKNVVEKGAFNKIANTQNIENEWFHTHIWQSRGISLNLVGINAICLKYDLEPGDVNL